MQRRGGVEESERLLREGGKDETARVSEGSGGPVQGCQ